MRVKAPLQAKNIADNSGVVALAAKAAGKRVSYNWQMSSDNGTTWADLPTTLQSKTTIGNLNPGARILFRVRPVLKNGERSWSNPVGLIVT